MGFSIEGLGGVDQIVGENSRRILRVIKVAKLLFAVLWRLDGRPGAVGCMWLHDVRVRVRM
jgi:hypothetical protein